MDAYARWDKEREERQDALYNKFQEHLDAPDNTEYVEEHQAEPNVTQSPSGQVHHPTITSNTNETEEP